MPVFQFNKAFRIARGVKTLLNLRSGIMRRVLPGAQRYEDRAEDQKTARQHASEQRKRLKSKRYEWEQARNELRAAKEPAERIEHTKRAKRARQEIFRLKRELRAAKEKQAEGTLGGGLAAPHAGYEEPGAGALPDFVIIGAKKCGTTSLYHLLDRHPHVESAATKELHYFDYLFDEESIEWYRRCFPPPSWKDGRRTITGEATPGYLFHRSVPGRMAEAIPEARLIALLRNPVDRAYSDYQHQVRLGQETRSFEEAIEAEMMRRSGKEGKTSEHEHRVSPEGGLYHGYLSWGVYVDPLLRWSKFFSDEQMLVLKSEDFFERPTEILKLVLGFLRLPDWEIGGWEIRNKGMYEQEMDPATRRRLEEYFEPHNRRLYEYLGTDFGW